MSIEDRYEVQEPMGEGGFARVFHGSERATGRRVALKILKSSFYNNAEVRERFQREVFAVASLQNPHIVALYDFDISDADAYIAMEYVGGLTLRERMRDKFDLAARYAILAQIADAVGAAHAANVVHRDLKPENVKVVRRDDGGVLVKVFDFGMAKLGDLESRLELEPLTRTGFVFGTPQYMSPEQIRGKLNDRSIDLYALAIMAFELLSGYRPWDGTDPYEVMREVMREPPPIIERLYGLEVDQPRIDALNAFFDIALAKDREQRPKDAFELIKGLERALFGEAGAPPQTVEEEPFRKSRADDTVRVDAMMEAPAYDAESAAKDFRDSPSTRRLDAAAWDASIIAAREFAKSQRRTWRDLVVPLVVLAVLGCAAGYFLAGSGSAESNKMHDFLVGKPR